MIQQYNTQGITEGVRYERYEKRHMGLVFL